MTRQIGILAGACVALWVLLAYPAFRLGGSAGLAYSLVAGALCLVPTLGTLAWTARSLRGSPDQQLVAVLGGTGLRIAFVLVTGLILYFSVPFFAQEGFLIWLVVFYLLTLALEVGVFLSHRPAAVISPAEK